MIYWIPIVCVVIAAVLTSLGGLMKKCEFFVKGQPPGWVFSIVWPILFVLLAFAGQQIWKTESIALKIGFILLLLTLVAWPYLQWTLCSPILGVITIISALVLVISLVVVGTVTNYWIGILLVPLLLWLSYATVLDIRTLSI